MERTERMGLCVRHHRVHWARNGTPPAPPRQNRLVADQPPSTTAAMSAHDLRPETDPEREGSTGAEVTGASVRAVEVMA
jgi:hypothetical protein